MKSFMLKRKNFKYIIYFLFILSLIFIYSEKGNATTINNFKRLNSNSNTIIFSENYLGAENFLYDEYVLNFGTVYIRKKRFIEVLSGPKSHLGNNFFVVKTVGLKMTENLTDISLAFQTRIQYRLNRNFELGAGIRKENRGVKPVISLTLNY